MSKRWTDTAKRALFNGLGAYGLDYFRRNGGPPEDRPGVPRKRTRNAVYAIVRRLYGTGGITRGVYALEELAKESGYHRNQIIRARDALNQKWRRTGPRGKYLISEEQVLDLYAWLKHGYWNDKHRLYNCAWCSTTDRPHKGMGLCNRCFPRHRRLCVSYSIPSTIQGQLRLVEATGSIETLTPPMAQFVGAATARLGRGLAVEEEQLEWLLVAAPDGFDPRREPPDFSGIGRGE